MEREIIENLLTDLINFSLDKEFDRYYVLYGKSEITFGFIIGNRSSKFNEYKIPDSESDIDLKSIQWLNTMGLDRMQEIIDYILDGMKELSDE